MQRRGKLNTAAKGRAAAVKDSKENKNISKGRKPAEAKQDAGVKKSKAAARSKPTSSDPIEACFDASNTVQKKDVSRKNNLGAKKLLLDASRKDEDMQENRGKVKDSQSKASAQEGMHGTAAAALHAAVAEKPGELLDTQVNMVC